MAGGIIVVLGQRSAGGQSGGPGRAWLKMAQHACTGPTVFVLSFPCSFLFLFLSVLSVLFCPFYISLGYHAVLFCCISLEYLQAVVDMV